VSAVATELQAKTAEEAKEIYDNVAKEVAATITNEDDETMMEKISEAIQVVTREVVEGVQDVGEAIKEHPEMIAE
jgi:hypothetical protein